MADYLSINIHVATNCMHTQHVCAANCSELRRIRDREGSSLILTKVVRHNAITFTGLFCLPSLAPRRIVINIRKLGGQNTTSEIKSKPQE